MEIGKKRDVVNDKCIIFESRLIKNYNYIAIKTRYKYYTERENKLIKGGYDENV